MYFTGLLIGIATFLSIGLFHPLVIKGEYYFGTRIWWLFADCEAKVYLRRHSQKNEPLLRAFSQE